MIISNEFGWQPPLVNPLNNHKEHKKILCELIDKFEQDNDTILTPDQANLDGVVMDPILSSDYFINSNLPREYRQYFYDEVIQPLVFQIGVEFGLLPFEYFIHDAWFQRYLETAEHSWHTHTGCQFSNVYFLELPDGEYVTEIKGPNGKLIEYSAKEACAKALGTGLARGVFWKDIEVKNDQFGKPNIYLHNKAKKIY